MTTRYVLTLSDSQATLMTVGGKGASLARLSAAGLPVPNGFHVTTDAYREFVTENDLQPGILAALDKADPAQPDTLEIVSSMIRALFYKAHIPPVIANDIVQAYAALPGPQPTVAVRSSATAEDLPEASFAGQLETYLNVSGPDRLLEATRKCWSSLWTARAIGYRARQGISSESVALAVVVQLLVPAEAAGILFTANPVTGARDQAVISASWGLGEAVVGGLVTPDTVTADKESGRVLSRETADKQIMTVPVNGVTAEQPVPESLRHVLVLNDAAAAELTRLGTQIEQLYQMPMDIEWTLCDGRFAVVQARPITALPEPPAPVKWKFKGIAMRNNIVELMADPLTPLFGTFGRKAINTSMNRILARFFGKEGLMPEELIVSVNDYAYYNGSLKPGMIGRILLGSVGIMRRMITGAIERWTIEGRPHYLSIIERWQASDWRELPATEILTGARELMEAAIEAYGALVSGIIPGAWISEGVFTFVYKLLIKRRDDPPAATYLLGFSSIPIQAEKSLYDLAQWVCSRPRLAAYLNSTPAAQLAADIGAKPAPSDVNMDDWRELRERFHAHLQRYGHTIYNLDFANPVPADDPTLLLETCKLFVSGQGVNPHTRQQAAAERREQETQSMLRRLKGFRLRLFRKFVTTAQRYAPLREDGLADIGLGYPLLRQMFLELGRRFVAGGLVEMPDDVFWLHQGEVESGAAKLDRGETLKTLSIIIPRRKAHWRAAKRLTPPRMLPHLQLPRLSMARIGLARSKKHAPANLKGVSASPGRVTATARVLHGPADFDQMRAGDVLVAPITTPAWTPLFVMASGIVTDVGGPLSHGSIVAREYGIPAVLGTGSATKRIRSGQVITVDGSAGIVTLPEDNQA